MRVLPCVCFFVRCSVPLVLEGEPVSSAVRVQLGVIQRVLGPLTACVLAGLGAPTSQSDASVALLHRPCLGLGAGECDAGYD